MSQSPLTRSNVTAASRITLPFWAAWNIVLGLTWTLQDEMRSSIGLRAIDDYVPVDVAGSLVTALGVVVAIGLCTHIRWLATAALLGGFILYIVFGIAVVVATDPLLEFHPWPEIILQNVNDSLTACYWFFGFAVLHLASARSLFTDEPSV